MNFFEKLFRNLLRIECGLEPKIENNYGKEKKTYRTGCGKGYKKVDYSQMFLFDLM